MTRLASMSMNRRTALKVGAGLGIAGGAGLLGYQLVPPSPSPQLERVDALARQLAGTLDAEQRADTWVPYDHPLRQYHNRGVWGGGREVLFGFSRRQRRLLTDLMHAGLSSEGRRLVPGQDVTHWSGVNALRVLLCGDPTTGPYQVILTGTHLNLRLGGASREGAAFGGPQVYGDQRGNERAGLPGNVYRDQFMIAETLLRSLDPERQKRAVLDDAPVQTGIELQGRDGVFPGLAIAELDVQQRAAAQALIDRILATYPPDDVEYARACLQANGGIDRLFLSYYQRGEDGAIPTGQVFRLEGPGAVLSFRGYPHVHAFVNVAMDAGAPLSCGELLSDNPVWLDRHGVKTLFETVMRAETGAELAFYPEDSVAGRLRPGPIRSGDIYSLESWQEDVEVGELHGSLLEGAAFARLSGASAPMNRTRSYTVAATTYGIDRLSKDLGRVQSRKPCGMLRNLTIAHLKRRGFGSAS